EQRSALKGNPPHPGAGSLPVAALYFSKSAQLNLGPGRAAQVLMVAAALGALLGIKRKGGAIALLLWLPLPFYAVSVAYAATPVFVPVWWPFSYYNVRYGIELLPAIAVGAGLFAPSFRIRGTVVMVFAALNYLDALESVPVCLQEARVNAVTRVAFETKLAVELKKLPPSSISPDELRSPPWTAMPASD